MCVHTSLGRAVEVRWQCILHQELHAKVRPPVFQGPASHFTEVRCKTLTRRGLSNNFP